MVTPRLGLVVEDKPTELSCTPEMLRFLKAPGVYNKGYFIILQVSILYSAAI